MPLLQISDEYVMHFKSVIEHCLKLINLSQTHWSAPLNPLRFICAGWLSLFLVILMAVYWKIGDVWRCYWITDCGIYRFYTLFMVSFHCWHSHFSSYAEYFTPEHNFVNNYISQIPHQEAKIYIKTRAVNAYSAICILFSAPDSGWRHVMEILSALMTYCEGIHK